MDATRSSACGATPRSSASATHPMRPTTARTAKPMESFWQIALYRVSYGTTGRVLPKSLNCSLASPNQKAILAAICAHAPRNAVRHAQPRRETAPPRERALLHATALLRERALPRKMEPDARPVLRRARQQPENAPGAGLQTPLPRVWLRRRGRDD